MTSYNVCFLLLSALSVPEINAAPTTYDQRQTGEVNVDAKFENFLVIIATSGSSNPFSSLASQALELNELISQRSKQQNHREEPSETVVYETEDADDGREPYHLEIVHVEREGDGTGATKRMDETSVVKVTEKIQSGASSVVSEGGRSEDGKTVQEVSHLKAPIDGETETKRIRSLWKIEPTARGLADGSTEEGKLIDVKDSRAEDDESPTRQGATKVTRPGISLKKQLSKKEEVNAAPSSEERNEFGNRYKDQLVLIGDGIENCGPGRYRDRSGICQDDASFN
ncbi:uncharacterized protein LOC108631020 isoform X2 [Ceratina calcarata]|uniref:Uncharacterized protein LOC108631020 isoform X2 n=1 Tax=Ceratina calcarata TaxID=156304 RepID=A0AAJ7JCJ5_9HYME|nr:uncharacterized protein LOC108631020 isoform X2 [Ceratina calcarata]